MAPYKRCNTCSAANLTIADVLKQKMDTMVTQANKRAKNALENMRIGNALGLEAEDTQSTSHM